MTEIPPPADSLSEDRALPGIVYGLYLLGAVTGGVTLFIGLIVAYANLADAAPRAFSHYRFAIRTFWLSIAWFIIGGSLVLFGGPLSLVLIGLPFLWLGLFICGAVGLWFMIRAGVGLFYIVRGQAYPRPKTWLI
jgi:uncharacterized membrane protein